MINFKSRGTLLYIVGQKRDKTNKNGQAVFILTNEWGI
jgi:hypothetical protein